VFSQFGEAYTQALEQALSDGKIDYFSSLNKREGAYSIGGEGVSPFILMN
jgi:oligoendopeptidase F